MQEANVSTDEKTQVDAPNDIPLPHVDPLVAALFLEQTNQAKLGENPPLDGRSGDEEDGDCHPIEDTGEESEPSEPVAKQRRYFLPAMSHNPAGTERVDANGDLCQYVPRKYYNYLLEKQRKMQSRSQFLLDNGVIILTDKRMVPGDTMEIQLGVWVVNPESRVEMESRINSQGGWIRVPPKKELERLEKRARNHINTIVLTTQQKTTKMQNILLGIKKK